MSSSPFAVRGAVDSGPSLTLRNVVGIRYDASLQRNRILYDGDWIDVTSSNDRLPADSFLTMTHHATMTRLPGEVGEGSKLDDDG